MSRKIMLKVKGCGSRCENISLRVVQARPKYTRMCLYTRSSLKRCIYTVLNA